MASLSTAAVDSLLPSYTNLGLSYKDLPQLLSNANDALRIVRDAPRVADREIDDTVVRLAESFYAQQESRPATVRAALGGGVFTPKTRELIRYCTEGFAEVDKKAADDFLSGHDIRLGFRLLEATPLSIIRLNKLEGKNGPEAWDASVEHLGLEDQLYLLRELALVSAVCREMSGFEPKSEIKFAFRRAGLENMYERFTDAMQRPEFVRAVERNYRSELDNAR